MATTIRRPQPAAPPVPDDTLGGIPLREVYRPTDVAADHVTNEVGEPGVFPYTRGIHQTMYRGRVWTMRQFSGFGSARQTNQRYHQLLDAGQTGLSVAFDMPTLMGRDSDDPRSRGEVGHCGVAVDSVEDMKVLFDGIDVGEVTTSMTINPSASITLAQYLVVAEESGVSRQKLGGTLQNDILKEYIAQKEFCFPIRHAMRLVTDSIVFSTEQLPRFHPVSISGYHIREAGSTAAQELAFTLADGFAYIEETIRSGVAVDTFAPRLSFFFDAHIDFFEEIAKFRAARRIYARRMRDKYGARDERSLKLKFHTQTAGVSLTAQQPENNIVRTAVEALAAVMGGTQSLHTNALDETLALPTAKAAQIALRTQQVLAYETGVPSVVDPLGGSWFVEKLTDEMEAQAEAYLEEIDARGGMVSAVEQGYPQREIAEAAFRFQRQLESGERVTVGVNAFEQDIDPTPPNLLRIEEKVEVDQVAALRRLRAERDNISVANRLDALREVAAGTENTMPAIVDCVRARCTEGEIIAALEDVFGTYREAPVF
ncbi:MAG TPA: methylmalonyl-CoA mutase family protein [Candidatus Angelobacter sp.]|jgi:methylmalonyl-CoA mutase N-terminal domain/subunit|nr:methylmalonyl-CoA mutase family protein [Candidatus Angelobacter sp.]